jgi:serine/threonine-protein kinase
MTELAAGSQLDHYKLESHVARSGMATIFRATDLNTGKTVAIKIPHPEVEADPSLFERFRREEDIGRRMDHPGVMKVLPDENRSQIYMAMEWIDGKLLRQIMNAEGKLDPDRAARIVARICDALEYIHVHHVAHRDLKPENVMIGADDEVKLIDFGIAASAGSRRLTFANFSQMMGTPEYISPEQVRGKRGDAKSDIFSVGVMLYEMLTGTVPFTGANPFAVMNDRILNSPVPPREVNPEITQQMQEIIYRAMERDPKNRYAHAREFAWDLRHPETVGVAEREELHDWRNRREKGSRRPWLYATLVLLPLAILALMWFLAQHK